MNQKNSCTVYFLSICRFECVYVKIKITVLCINETVYTIYPTCVIRHLTTSRAYHKHIDKKYAYTFATATMQMKNNTKTAR